jgi:hypothetical protein
MHLALLIAALQIRAVTPSEAPTRVSGGAADSVRDLGRSKSAQVSFERSRRSLLPASSSNGGRCDVRLGRYCWWYDESTPTFPPESEIIGRRRAELLAQLDGMAFRYPGDDWIAGMRVHYRLDARDLVGADTVARSCRATGWWCAALVGYVAHARGDGRRADSAFASAIASMPVDVGCAWRSIAPLLADDERDEYERRPCNARAELEKRYWLLSRPQLASTANEWQNEFNVRRVLVRLGERAATPYPMTWGDDAAELVLRYGWPSSWSRVVTSGVPGSEPSVVGHDPSPSFSFAPARWLADSMTQMPDEAWEPNALRAEARYAPRLVRRLSGVAVQIARFRRGDSSLVVAAFSSADDSLHAPMAFLGAAEVDGAVRFSPPDSARTGIARVMLAGAPFVVGVEVTDTSTQTLARRRIGFVPAIDSARLSVSDLLLYRAGEMPATSLDSALALAIPGDTVTRNRQLGLFWETYGLAAEGETLDLAVSVERVDHSWIRSARQRLGLTPVDTPIRIRWTDARPPANRTAAHAVSLDLANLDSGRYRLTLALTPEGGAPVSTTREIELIDP